MLKPLSGEQWNFTTAAHLLNRAGFGGSPAEISRLAALEPARAVSQFVEFDDVTQATPDPAWARPDPDRAERLARPARRSARSSSGRSKRASARG